MPDLSYDVAQRVKRQSRGLMPPGGGPGRVLQKSSSTDYDAEWMPIKHGEALPDGGTVGQVLTKRSYVDGDADWEDIAPTASSFPVGPEDDGVATHEIEINTPGGGVSEQQASATGDVAGNIALLSLGIVTIGGQEVPEAAVAARTPGTPNQQAFVLARVFDGVASVAEVIGENASAETAGLLVQVGPSGGTIDIGNGVSGGALTNVIITLGFSGDALMLNNLPTSDPGNPGQAWNDSGTVKVSP